MSIDRKKLPVITGVWVGSLLSGDDYFQDLLGVTIFLCYFQRVASFGGGGSCYLKFTVYLLTTNKKDIINIFQGCNYHNYNHNTGQSWVYLTPEHFMLQVKMYFVCLTYQRDKFVLTMMIKEKGDWRPIDNPGRLLIFLESNLDLLLICMNSPNSC